MTRSGRRATEGSHARAYRAVAVACALAAAVLSLIASPGAFAASTSGGGDICTSQADARPPSLAAALAGQPAPLPADNPCLSTEYVGPNMKKARRANDCNAAAPRRNLCIAYWTVGPLAADPPADQPPLLMINGSASTASEWDPHMLARLAGNRLLILPDNRCVGNSGCRVSGDGEAVVAIEYMADDMNAFLLALPADLVDGPIDVLGWSMGGEVAQSLATRYSQRVRRLVLAGTLPGSGLVANEPCAPPYDPDPDTDAIFGCGPTTLGPDWANDIDDSATCQGSGNRGRCQDLQLRTLFQPCYPDPTDPDEDVCTWNSGTPAPPPVTGEHACTQPMSAYSQWPGKQAACAFIQRLRVASGDLPDGRNDPDANAELPDDFSLDPQGYGTADAQDDAENDWLYGTPAPDPPPTNPNWQNLDGLAMPVFVAGAAGDVLTPGQNSQAIHDRILAGSPPVAPSLVTYQAAGHAFLFQCNEDFASRIDAFLVAATPGAVDATPQCVSDVAPSPDFAAAALAPAAATLPETIVGGTSAPQTFNLSNPGSTPLGLGGVSIAAVQGEQGSEEFTVGVGASGSCQAGATLQPGESCVFVVSYAPTVAGVAAGTLTVDTDAGPQTATLAGTGVQPDVSVTPQTRSFGPVAPGGSASYVFTVEGDGGGPQEKVAGFSVTGDAASQFSVAAAEPVGCAQGTALSERSSACALTVTFAPDSAGAFTAQLEVQTSAGAAAADLTGTASPEAPAPSVPSSEPQQTVVTAAGSGTSPVGPGGTAQVGVACLAASDGNCSGSMRLLAAQTPALAGAPRAADAAAAARGSKRPRRDRRRPGAVHVGRVPAFSVAERRSRKVTIELNRHGRKLLSSGRRVSMILRQRADDGSPPIERRIALRLRDRGRPR